MRRILAFTTLAATLGAAQAQAQAQTQQTLAFVACPIMRDTATVPCWLAEYKGETYFLTTQGGAATGASPPALGHQALIEGTPTGETRCGGKVLSNLRISVRPEIDRGCDVILPATAAFQIAEEVKPPAPSAEQPAAAGAAPPPPAALAPGGSQRFEISYDFDSQNPGRNTGPIAEAVAYSKANPKAEVHITGFRAAVKLTAGGVLSEDESIGLRRARELVESLVTLGLERNALIVVDKSTPELGDYTQRRAFIDIVMGGGDEPNSEH